MAGFMDDLGGGAKPYDFLQITFHGKGHSVQPGWESRGRCNLQDDTFHNRMPWNTTGAILPWKAICRKQATPTSLCRLQMLEAVQPAILVMG
ncbi:MAG: hypothetical protein MJY69_08645 [Bacteroidales bacterium]|nr:hypothetical protein [Bacteroidales bacterium]